MFSTTGRCNQVVRNTYIPNVDQICVKDECATLRMQQLHTYVAVTMSVEEDSAQSRAIRGL